MRLEGIRCLCAVAEAGSFRGAAGLLNRTQPAVTQQIQGLEREVGRTLLDRAACELTPAGRVVYERGKELLLGVDNLSREVAEFDEATSGELRIGTSDTNALYFLPRHIKRFSKRFPHIRFAMVSRSSDEVADSVERGALDVGIVTLPMARRTLETRKLYEQRLVLVTPKSHPLARRRRVSLQNLEAEPMALLDRDTRTGRILFDHFEKEGFEPHVVMDSGSFEVLKRYVREGVGVSILPEMIAGMPERNPLKIVRLSGLPTVGIGVVWRRGVYRTKASRAFVDLLMETSNG